MWEGVKSFTDMRLIFNEIACMVKEVKEKVKIIGVIRAREGAFRQGWVAFAFRSRLKKIYLRAKFFQL